MAEMKRISLHDGVQLHRYIDPNFKTFRISVHMMVPLAREEVSKNCLLPAMVSRVSREYPDYTAMSAHLADLYGAHIDSGVTKMGKYQVMTLSVGGIANRYAFDGENIEEEQRKLLFSVLFDPFRDSDGLFPEEGFDQEKRQTLEAMDSEFNDKIFYARKQALALFLGDAVQGISKKGTREQVAALTREELSAQWEKLMKEAQFEIFLLGDCASDPEAFRTAFQGYGVNYQMDHGLAPKVVEKVKEKIEPAQTVQSKLVMIFRGPSDVRHYHPQRMMAAVFGGSPSAKLFLNVREKMGLCYYCAANIDPLVGCMIVESGVDTENVEKAKEAILDQLAQLQAGELTDEEMLHTRLALCNGFRGVTDSLSAIENWYLTHCLFPQQESPIQAMEKIAQVTKEDVVNAANALKLDTVFVLKGE